jgi:Coenzyme PQQ synthesis protein D (PqqD)
MSRVENVYRQRPNIIAREIADEFILVPISDELTNMHSFFTLNSVGRFIWEQLDGTKQLQTITGSIAETFEVTPETARDDLYQLIDELEETGLIVPVKG